LSRRAALSVAAEVPDELVAFGHQLADLAAEVVARYYRAAVAVESKLDASPVTIADREAEAAMRELILARYPDHGIAGEEFGSERPDAELVWHLDPIDGTKSFIGGRPLFGTLVGLSRAGRPVLGIIDQCILRERWLGVAGRASRWNGEPSRVRPCPSLDHALLYTTSPLLFAAGAERAAFEQIQQAVRYPLFGGDCYAYGLLALGFADLVVEAGLDEHDFMALVPVVEGAGGLMTDWQGRPLGRGSTGRVLAAGDPRVHAEALDRLAAAGY
jgi:inositol-phosphate phosphatase / L-galactose 1-phosphate phosphatase / histidinol-phosphatase